LGNTGALHDELIISDNKPEGNTGTPADRLTIWTQVFRAIADQLTAV
jgi:hypothetical protein